MTITPMAPLPATPAGPAMPANGDAAAAATGFGALIAEQLGLLADPTAVPGEPVEPVADAAPATAESETDPGAETGLHVADPTAGCVAVALTAPAALPVPAAAHVPTAAPADGPEPVAAKVVTAPVEAAPNSAPAPGPVSPAGIARPLRTSDVTTDSATDGGAPAEVATTDATKAPQQPTPLAPAADAAPRTDLPASAAAPVALTAPVVSSGAVTTPAGAPAPVSNPVLDQVTPAFSRLVSGPEGTHRMMLRLHPADLGEVHLTVTVRGDTVDVTVAASPEARELLTDGSSQLRGLLDAVGRNAGQIVFRDLPGTGSTVQVIQTDAGGANPDGQPAASYDGTGRSDGSGAQRDDAHRDDRHDGGRHQPAAGREGSTSSDHRTNPTRTSAAGLVRGGLDVRM